MKSRTAVLLLAVVVVLLLAGVIVFAYQAGARHYIFQSDEVSRIRVAEEIEAQVAFADKAGIRFERFTVDAAIESLMDVPVEDSFSVPLDFDLTFPVNASMRVDQEFRLDTELPLQFELSPDDLDMGSLMVDIDTEVFINDEVEVELMVPVDATLRAFGVLPVPVSGSLPVKMRVPVHQPVRIRDQVAIDMADFRLKVDTLLPVQATIPIHEDVQVSGQVTGRLRETVEVPISERISVPIKQTVPVGLHLAEEVEVTMEQMVPTRIRFDEALPVKVESLRFSPQDVRVEPVE